MDFKKQRESIIASSELALEQLQKLIVQNIDLSELDPEKAKAAAQGKIEAIEGSFRILARIEEELDRLQSGDKEDKKEAFFNVEAKIKNK